MVVVDNGSTEPLVAVIAAHPRIRFVTETAQGRRDGPQPGRGRDDGAPGSSFSTADCVPAPDWLAVALQTAARADLVGGTVTLFDETPPPRNGAAGLRDGLCLRQPRLHRAQGLFGHRQPSDPARRLRGGGRSGARPVRGFWTGATAPRAQGYRLIHAPDLCVAHPTRGDWPALERKWRRLTEESFGVNGSGPGARLRWGLRALAMPVSVLAHAPRGLAEPRPARPG